MKVTPSDSTIVIEWEQDQFEASPRSTTALKNALSSVQGVQSVKLSGRRHKKIVVVYQSPLEVVAFLREITHALRSFQEGGGEPKDGIHESQETKSADPDKQPGSILHGLKQGTFGFLACGSFVMAWVGLIVPGIPTIPFVILTVYFAEKVSPTLRRTLMDTPVIGAAMRDWSENHAIRRSVRDRVYILMAVMILIAMLVTPMNSMQFMGVIMIAGMSIYMINRIPVIEDPVSDNQPGLVAA